jgi:hypothetical protein
MAIDPRRTGPKTRPVANVGRNVPVKPGQSGSGGGAFVRHSGEGAKVEPKTNNVSREAVSVLGAHEINLRRPEPLLERGAASPKPAACTVHRSGGQGRH